MRGYQRALRVALYNDPADEQPYEVRSFPSHGHLSRWLGEQADDYPVFSILESVTDYTVNERVEWTDRAKIIFAVVCAALAIVVGTALAWMLGPA